LMLFDSFLIHRHLSAPHVFSLFLYFFFHYIHSPHLFTLSLHDALPISCHAYTQRSTMSQSLARNGATDLDKSTIDYAAIADPGHGNSVAGWTGVIIMLIGVSVGCVGFTIHNPTITYVSIGIVSLGIIVGLILRAVGLGNKPKTQ